MRREEGKGGRRERNGMVGRRREAVERRGEEGGE